MFELQLDLISLLVNFSYELGKMMTRYDFLDIRFVILTNVWNRLALDLFHFWSPNEFGQTMTWYDFLEARWMILSDNWTDFNLTYRINACISRDIYPWTWYHTDNSSYTQVTPPGKKKKSVVSDNTWIDEYSIAPLIYHWYTNQFLCYSLDIVL